ncbi:hypothetical protein LV476_01940 [Guyparkeria hydrothermalis]|uniref:hypothetical protein n=1 Tax=Guyparkeria hydrothermalis TaxID=923 RepID=UPI00202235CF|nr:hypothetical protein [Guyparkeria hydrothermalis]MCL7743713.1 hypothetical protein [Guyparkeria hydrothermalis]
MERKELGSRLAGYVHGMEVLGGVFGRIVRSEAHDVRGVLNGISMAAYNSRVRVTADVSPDVPINSPDGESIRAIENKLQRIIDSTRALDQRLQILLDLVSAKPADIFSALKVYESLVPDLMDAGFIEIRLPEKVSPGLSRLSGIHALALLTTWTHRLETLHADQDDFHGGVVGGVIELCDGGDRQCRTLKLVPALAGGCNEPVFVSSAVDAFAALSETRLPEVHIPLEP